MPKPEARFTIAATDKTRAVIEAAERRFTKAVKSISVATVAATGAAAASFAALTREGLKSGDALAKSADRIGITTEALAGLRHGAELAGGSVDGLDEALVKATKRLGEAAELGTGAAARWLDELNLDVRELQRLAPDELFATYAEAISGLNDRGAQLAATSALMGDESRRLINFLDQGREGMAAARAEAERYGLAISRVDAAKIEAANDSLARAKAVVRGVGLDAAVAMAPWVEVVAKSFADGSTASGGFRETALSDLKAITAGAFNLADVFHEMRLNSALAAVESNRRVVEQQRELLDFAERVQGIPIAGSLASRLMGSPDEIESDLGKLQERLAAAEGRLVELAPQSALPSAWFERVMAEAEERAREIRERIEAQLNAGTAAAPGTGGLAAKERDALQGKLDRLRESLMSEEEAVRASYDRRLEIVNQALEKEADPTRRAELFDLRIQAATDFQNRLTAIEAAGLTERERFQQLSLEAQASNVFSTLAGITAGVAQHSKGLFRLNQVAGIANAIISTHEGIAKALSAYPPPLSFAMAAAQAAAGFAQVNAIRSASFAGGGRGTTPSAAGSVPTVNSQPVGATAQPAPQPERTVIFEFRGIDPGLQYSGQQLRDFAAALAEEFEDFNGRARITFA